MGSRRSRFAAFFIALALALLSVAGIINAAPGKAAINPGTGCGEDSFLGNIFPPAGSTVHPGDLVGATFVDESVLYNPTDPADHHHPPNPLPGAVFGLWAGNTVVGNPIANCTSQANGTCTFDNLDAGTYTTHETSAPAGYSPDPATVTVTVGIGETKDIAQPFVDPRDTGWVRVVKVLQDSTG